MSQSPTDGVAHNANTRLPGNSLAAKKKHVKTTTTKGSMTGLTHAKEFGSAKRIGGGKKNFTRKNGHLL